METKILTSIIEKYKDLAAALRRTDENGNKAQVKYFVMVQYAIDTDIASYTNLYQAIEEYNSSINHLTKQDKATVTLGIGLFNKYSNNFFEDENGNVFADYDDLEVVGIKELEAFLEVCDL